MIKLSLEQVRRLRLRAQRLHPDHAASGVARLVQDVCGIQAQELPAAALAVRARSARLTLDDVQHAREVDRSIVLTWCMRGTLHLIPAEDVGAWLAFFGPIFIRGNQRRYNQLGLDSEIHRRAARVMQEALSQRGPLTRPELAGALAAQGIPVEGQAIAHLVGHAALEGLICFGPLRAGKQTYVILEDWIRLTQPLDAHQTLADLAHRYLDAYGPAAPDDFARWSGLSMRQARTAFDTVADDCLAVEIDDSPAWMLARHADWLDAPPGDPIVRLLPNYDLYLLGYRGRDFMVSEAYARRLHPGGGQIKACLIVDGRARGTWRIERHKHTSTVVVEPFEPLDADILPALEVETQDIGRFLHQTTALRVETP